MADLFRRITKELLGILLILLFSFPAAALEVPSLQGRVNDNAGILSASTESLLESRLSELEKSDSTQIVILTIPSLKGESLEEFSLRTVEAWKIGQQRVDNGAMLLIARDDRKLRIEVGYGLEGTLTDLTAGRIIRNVITPQFRNGNYDQGVIDGVEAMISAVRGAYQAGVVPELPSSPKGNFGEMMIALMFILFFFGSLFRKNKILAGVAGGVITPLFGVLFLGITGWLLLLLILVGIVGGIVASALAGSSGGVGMSGGGHYGGFSGGGGSSFGGFSGGGGGFGGGGASGGW